MRYDRIRTRLRAASLRTERVTRSESLGDIVGGTHFEVTADGKNEIPVPRGLPVPSAILIDPNDIDGSTHFSLSEEDTQIANGAIEKFTPTFNISRKFVRLERR